MGNFIKKAFSSMGESAKNINQDKVRRILSLVTSLVIIILLIILMKSCEKQDYLRKEIQTIRAINDTLRITSKTDTTIIYSKEVITLPAKDIIKEGIPIKDPNTKKFVDLLAKEKQISAALSLELIRQDSIIASFKSNAPKDTNCYATYNFEDSVGRNLTYHGIISIDSVVNLNLQYKYRLGLISLVKLDRVKKGYQATYKFDDPSIVLNNADFLFIPKPELSKGQKALNILIPTLSGLAGGAIGYTIGHYLVPPRK